MMQVVTAGLLAAPTTSINKELTGNDAFWNKPWSQNGCWTIMLSLGRWLVINDEVTVWLIISTWPEFDSSAGKTERLAGPGSDSGPLVTPTVEDWKKTRRTGWFWYFSFHYQFDILILYENQRLEETENWDIFYEADNISLPLVK